MSTNRENEPESHPPDAEEAVDTIFAAESFGENAREIRLFLIGVLRDSQLADDVLQTTFVRLTEKGGGVDPQKIRSWLFQVAYNEAIAIRRREKIGDKVLRKVAWSAELSGTAVEQDFVRRETDEKVRNAINELTVQQREVVRLRIYEEKTFATIAAELQVPLGTVLGRMQSALKRMRSILKSEDPIDNQ